MANGSGNALLAAASGNETLTGSAPTGDNLYFGGTDPDLIVAGAGNDTVVADSGATTVFGGTGPTAVFAGSGTDVIVAGQGGDYIGESIGNSTAWIGADAGSELFGFVAGQGGGSDQILGFAQASIICSSTATGPVQSPPRSTMPQLPEERRP